MECYTVCDFSFGTHTFIWVDCKNALHSDRYSNGHIHLYKIHSIVLKAPSTCICFIQIKPHRCQNVPDCKLCGKYHKTTATVGPHFTDMLHHLSIYVSKAVLTVCAPRRSPASCRTPSASPPPPGASSRPPSSVAPAIEIGDGNNCLYEPITGCHISQKTLDIGIYL